MALQPGTRLGPYEIVSALGAGGMGEVYRARDTRLPRAVALKILSPALAADSAFRTRFSREARIISQLDHPNICVLYDVGQQDGTSFIVMQLLEGRSLADRSGPASISETVRIGVAIASALAYAHERGVLHRDVKPRNVMVHSDGTVKLLDFGIAKAMVEGSGVSETAIADLTHDGSMIGTLEYMSPEQLAGKGLDARTDIFSLAVVLYELASGRHPFRGESRLMTAAAILNCRYEPIGALDRGTKALDAVLRKALVRDPAQRYSTMAEFLAELQRVQRIRAWNGWPAKVAAAVAVAAAALLAAFLSSGVASRSAETASAPPPADRSSQGVSAELLNARPGSGSPALERAAYKTVSAERVTGAPDRIGEIGVTLWRLRRSRSDDVARLLVHEPAIGETQWTPERVDLGTPLSAGDRVRLSVESPRNGFLYVIDRERFAQDATGEPFLIFPTNRTSGGDNRLTAGRLIDIPSQGDRPPYFTIRRSRSDQSGELITLIVSSELLKDVPRVDDRVQLPAQLVADWERQGTSSSVERLEMIGGAGRAWSLPEQRAGADATRRLTQDDPGPQTLFRVVTSTPGFLVAQITLEQR